MPPRREEESVSREKRVYRRHLTTSSLLNYLFSSMELLSSYRNNSSGYVYLCPLRLSRLFNYSYINKIESYLAEKKSQGLTLLICLPRFMVGMYK